MPTNKIILLSITIFLSLQSNIYAQKYDTLRIELGDEKYFKFKKIYKQDEYWDWGLRYKLKKSAPDAYYFISTKMGIRQFEGVVKKRKRQGLWFCKNHRDQLISQAIFVDDRTHGTQLIFYPKTGVVNQEITYVEGIICQITVYDNNGALYSKTYYDKGQKVKAEYEGLHPELKINE